MEGKMETNQSEVWDDLKLLSLDYDNVSYSFLFSELTQLKSKFNLPFSLFESSKDHYHIRVLKPIDEALAFKVLEFSRCSKDYKAFCKKVKRFPIRIGEKVKYRHDGSIEVSPPPRLLFHAGMPIQQALRQS
jgi:hypothetical protein